MDETQFTKSSGVGLIIFLLTMKNSLYFNFNKSLNGSICLKADSMKLDLVVLIYKNYYI